MAQIDDLHSRLGRSDTLAAYLQGLAAIGVVAFESYLVDGRTEYVDEDGERLVSPPHHEVLAVAETSDRVSMLEHLQRHHDRETSYVEMSRGLASSGVEKWVADTAALTMTYLDRAGTKLLVEHLEKRPTGER